jgi:hypothetical protein
MPASTQAHALPDLGDPHASAHMTLGDALQVGPVRVQWDLDPLGQRQPTLWLKQGDTMERYRAPEPQDGRPNAWEVQALGALWLLQGDRTLALTLHRLDAPLAPLAPDLIHAQAVSAVADCDIDPARAAITFGQGVWHVQFFDDGGTTLCGATVGAWSGRATPWR